MRRVMLVMAMLAIAFAVFFYLRPFTILFALRDVQMWAEGVKQKDVRVGAHKIHYLAVGHGPPLVLIHGLGMSAPDLSPLFSALARTHRVYAIDLLGSGHSDWPRDSMYSMKEQADVVRGFMDALSLRNPDVLGVSMGGWVALELAAEHPSRVRRLILVSSAGFEFETDIHEEFFVPQNVAGMRYLFTRVSDRAGKLPDFILRDFLRVAGDNDWVVRRATRTMLERRELMDGRVRTIRMPVLLVWGTNDRIIPFSVAAKMQREMPQARLVRLEHCGHLAIVECRDVALPAIEAFLRQ